MQASELKSVFGEFADQFLKNCDSDGDVKISLKEWVAGEMCSHAECTLRPREVVVFPVPLTPDPIGWWFISDCWFTGIMTETKEMADADFQTEWVARMEECIGNREESAENRAPTPNRTRPGAGGEDEDDSENLPIADLSEKYGVAWQVHSCYITVGKLFIIILLRSQHSM